MFISNEEKEQLQSTVNRWEGNAIYLRRDINYLENRIKRLSNLVYLLLDKLALEVVKPSTELKLVKRGKKNDR